MPAYNPNCFDSTEDIRPIRSATPAGSGRGAALHGLSDFPLPLGSYTAIVRGANNTTGNALVEVYALP